MIDPHDPTQERILELLADRAVFGLSDDEQLELDQLILKVPQANRDRLELLAADLTRSYLPEVLQPLPAHIADKVLAGAASNIPAQSTNPSSTPRTHNIRLLLGGIALAASAFIAVGIWWSNRTAHVPTVAERRNELLAKAGQSGQSVIRMEWTATEDPAAEGASGDVVWNNETQEGYMSFRGLVANNPTREQYQLWVFDASRDERYPVDGGVFDVPSGTGEVIVPIRVKLGVSKPILFAVTIEPPGGVVVSSRARLPLLAKVPAKPG